MIWYFVGFMYGVAGFHTALFLRLNGYAQGFYFLWALLFWPVFALWAICTSGKKFWIALTDYILWQLLLILATAVFGTLLYYLIDCHATL